MQDSLGALYIGVFKHSNKRARKYLVHFAVCEMLLSGTALKNDAVCLASRDPNQASCAQSVNASKVPNKCSEDSLRLEFRLLETLGERKQRDSFTWTMKHSSTDWQRVGNDLPVQLKSVVYHKMNGTF